LTTTPSTPTGPPSEDRSDGQATITLIGGTLLILLSFFTSYSHVHLLGVGTVPDSYLQMYPPIDSNSAKP